MSTTTPDQQIVIPVGTDPADNPDAFVDMIAGVESRLLLRYTSNADRTARNPVPVFGQLSVVGTNTWYDRWTGTKWLPATPIYKAKTANQIVNNSAAFINDTELFVPLPAANSWYNVDLLVRYTSTTAADIKFTFTAPALATVVMAGPGMVTTAAGQSSDADWEGITAPAARPYGGAGGVTISAYKIHATVQTGANTGNLQLQWAQNTADPSNTTLFGFSTLKLEAIQ